MQPINPLLPLLLTYHLRMIQQMFQMLTVVFLLETLLKLFAKGPVTYDIHRIFDPPPELFHYIS